MELYKITITHLAPKDSAMGIKEYLVAESEVKVFEYLTKGDGSDYTYWNDKVDINEYIGDGYETAEEKMNHWISKTMSERGEHWNSDLYTDLYYGRSIYGWELTGINDKELLDRMVEFGIAKMYI